MPVYLFTYHAGSWMPDRKQGYVKRHQGILPSDAEEASRYRGLMVEDPKEFDEDTQRAILTSLIESRDKQDFVIYYLATEPSHVHLLIGWNDERPWLRMRSTVKGSVSRSLNQKYYKKEWLAEGGSRKWVQDRTHFAHLVDNYLPKHSGWKWTAARGFFL